MVKLLMRFYDVNSGSISVDGVDIQKIQAGRPAQYVWYGLAGHLVV